jgi:hypothetical protein
MNIKSALTIAAIAMSTVLTAAGQTKATTAAPNKAAATQATSWDDLMPKDWNPGLEFKNMDLNSLTDNDPRAVALLQKLRTAWDNAPANPAMDGAAVRLPGYVVPLEESKQGLKEFLLVPYFGACIHTPPPPANQIVHVKSKVPMKALSSMDTVWITGTLQRSRSDTAMGITSYTMEQASVERYTEKAR